MTRKDRSIIRSFMRLEYSFSGIRLEDSYLSPTDWAISLDIAVYEKAKVKKEELEHRAGVAFQKIYFWLDTNLQDVVVINASNENDFYLSNSLGNIVLYLPGSVSDDILIRALHSKITTLAGTNLIVGELRLDSSNSMLKYTFDCIDKDYGLAETTAEYCIEGKIKDSIPWWKRDDGFCSEFIKSTDDKTPDEEYFGNIEDPMVEFYNAMKVNSIVTKMPELAKIVKVERWQPKKVE